MGLGLQPAEALARVGTDEATCSPILCTAQSRRPVPGSRSRRRGSHGESRGGAAPLPGHLAQRSAGRGRLAPSPSSSADGGRLRAMGQG